MTVSELTDIAACSLDAGAAARRAADLRALLQPRLRRLARDGDTATLDLEMGVRAEPELEDLLRLERECCPFWRFGVERRSARRVRLTVTATAHFGDALDAFLSLTGPVRTEEATFRAGDAARRAGVGIETLRYYERRGLLPRARLRIRAEAKLTEVEDRIRGLELMRAELRAVIPADCDRLIDCECGDCPIVGHAPVPPRRVLDVRR